MRSSGKSKLWDKSKKARLLEELERLYPEPESELNFRSDFQLIIAVALSAQCTDLKVNQVTPQLFKAYKNFKQLASAKIPDVEKIIRPINYYRTKAKNIVALSQRVTEEFHGQLPRTREGLTELPGVGRKTASVILSEKGIEPAFPVDTHVFRVSRRLRLATRKDRDKVEEQVKAKFDPSEWRNLHHRLIFHGRRVCKAQRPKCGECTLSPLCPSA